VNDELERMWKDAIVAELKVLHFPGGTEENYHYLNQDSRSLDRDLNPGPSEFETGYVNHSTTTFGFSDFLNISMSIVVL
jgi:hypothetical protein